MNARHLRMASRFAMHRFRSLHPFEVQASLMNACNLRCVYCRCPDTRTDLLTKEQWTRIIKQLAAVGTIRIKFQGGEPTLRPDFKELSAASRAAGIITAVITNGTRIAAQPDLLDHLDEVVFSLDAVTPEIHDRLRGQGTHADVVRAIGLAAVRAVRTFVVMVVNRANLHELDAMLEFCEARAVRMHAQPVVFDGKYFDPSADHLALTAEETRDMYQRLARWREQGRAVMFSAATYRHTADWPEPAILRKRSEGVSSCMAGKCYIHIEPNGDVHPCAAHCASLTPKNILTDGFEAALLHVTRHDCGDCGIAYLNERKAVFGLRPSAVLSVLRQP